MRFDVGDIVKACVTKATPNQKLGLSLEERSDCRGDSRRRIFIAEINGGLFQKLNVPVHVGDQILEINGISTTNKKHFPRGLKDVKKYLKKEKNIQVRVRKGGLELHDPLYGGSSSTDDLDSGESSIDSCGTESANQRIYEDRRPWEANHPIHSEAIDVPRSMSALLSTSNHRNSRVRLSSEKKISNRRIVYMRKSQRNNKPKGTDPKGKKHKTELDERSSSTGTCTTEPTHRTGSTDSIPIGYLRPNSIRFDNINNSQQKQQYQNDDSTTLSPITVASFATSFRGKGKGIQTIHGDRNGIDLVLEDGSRMNVKTKPVMISEEDGRLVVYTSEQQATIPRPPLSSPANWKKGPIGVWMKDSSTEREDNRVDNDDVDDGDEESIACLTNLIEPGDLMKITGFRSRPAMNGSTVEVLRRSVAKEHRKHRWDVRVLINKDGTQSTLTKLISVDKKNLKHFV